MNLHIVVIFETGLKLVVPKQWIKDLSEKNNFIGGAKQYIKRILYCPREYPGTIKTAQSFEIPADFKDKDHCYEVYILKSFGKD